MYLLCQIPRRYGDISPHFPSILIPRLNIIRHIAMLYGWPSYLSYADDVRKEMTKPRTVPRTVNSSFETPRL